MYKLIVFWYTNYVTDILIFLCEEFYQHSLAKALAHNFESKMLFLDLNDLSAKVELFTFCHLNFLYV